MCKIKNFRQTLHWDLKNACVKEEVDYSLALRMTILSSSYPPIRVLIESTTIGYMVSFPMESTISQVRLFSMNLSNEERIQLLDTPYIEMILSQL